MATSYEDDPSGFMRLMRERYETAIDAERENREEALDDLRFRAGDQWPEQVRQEREADGRPCLTINRMPQFIRQVTGDIRINKPSIKVLPRDGQSDPKLAEVLTGLIRQIEYQSDAQSAYNTAAENAAACGMGAFRITTEYADDDGFDQDIFIRRIRNPFAVVWDPDSTELTREDAKFCFVHEEISKEEFRARYPHARMADFEADEPAQYLRDWFKGETVRIAEYWCKKPETRKLGMTASGAVLELDKFTEEQLAILRDPMRTQDPIVRERDVETFRIEQHIVSGLEVLEGPFVWPGRFIPIIPVWGEEVNLGAKVYRHGLIRFAKDPQRMYNYHRSAAVEMIALAPKAPFIGTVKQFAGLERYWREANVRNLPYLPYNPDPTAGGAPQRQPGAEVPAAMLQESAISADDMKAVTGIYDAALGARSNETSGKAILARQQEGDVGTFVYIDNLARAIAYCGRQLVDLIPKIYDTERVIRVLGEDDSAEFVTLNLTLPDGTVVNDISAGKYDVIVQTGPSYSTKRAEASDSMIAFAQAVPQAATVIGDLIAKNQDWPGADEIAKRLRKIAVAQGFAEPEEGDAPPPPDPVAEAEARKAEMDAMKAQADVAKAEADTEGKQLDNAQKALELALQTGQLQQIVAQEVARVLMSLGPGGPMAAAPQMGQPMQPGSPGFFNAGPNGGTGF